MKRIKLKNLIIGYISLSSMLLAGGSVVPVPEVGKVVETTAWSFELEPYMYAAGMNGDMGFKSIPEFPVDVTFGDILDVFDMGAMVHFEAHHESGWGIWLDYGFMDLSQDTVFSEHIDGVLSMGMRQGILEAFALYRQKLELGRIDYMAGIRWIDNDYDMLIDIGKFPSLSRSTSIEGDWIDLVIGANWAYDFSEDWRVKLRGDIGGFGLESDFTATAVMGVEYAINDLLSLDLQYKAAWFDYENGSVGDDDYFSYDMLHYGPIIGLKFKF